MIIYTSYDIPGIKYCDMSVLLLPNTRNAYLYFSVQILSTHVFNTNSGLEVKIFFSCSTQLSTINYSNTKIVQVY